MHPRSHAEFNSSSTRLDEEGIYIIVVRRPGIDPGERGGSGWSACAPHGRRSPGCRPQCVQGLDLAVRHDLRAHDEEAARNHTIARAIMREG